LKIASQPTAQIGQEKLSNILSPGNILNSLFSTEYSLFLFNRGKAPEFYKHQKRFGDGFGEKVSLNKRNGFTNQLKRHF
jgi:hypothetical protein